jgi:DNA/RNA-binding domain of Phe-tRNA-synthetase-like protein
MGVAAREYPSSIEAMLRRAAKTAEPFRLMPLVDWYNAVSLTHQVPVGAFDLGRVRADIDLRPTRPGDRFLALDADAPVEPAPGEVAYATGATVLTRHFVWRQAQEGLIRPDTRDVFVVSEILPAVGDDVAAAVLADLAHGLGAWFGAEVETFALDASRPTAHW